MTVTDWIRLIVIVGGYSLLRGRLLEFVKYMQGKQHEEELDTDELQALHERDESLKNKVHIPDDTDSESEDEGTKAADWGKKARRRQRKVVRALIDQEEKRRKEQDEGDSDADIREYLVD